VLNTTTASNEICVLPDEFQGGRSIVDLLAGAGHLDSVAVIGAGEPTQDSDITVTVSRRFEGMWSGFRDHDIEPYITVASREWELANRHEAGRRILAASRLPKAIICLNDCLAFGVCRAVTEAGLRAPDDVSVASFDDEIMAHYVEPQLTTITLP
jgi:LacI family transcriptional regulator